MLLMDRILNPFFTPRSTGTALGLATVHRILDAHGGSIGVHNAPAPAPGSATSGGVLDGAVFPEGQTSGGAVFELSLPVHEEHPIPQGVCS
jgi:signal transduction histidine kinase